MTRSFPENTPTNLGYRWPAEWEPHEATWIAWPHNRETWPGKFDRIPAAFDKLVRTLADFEPVFVLAGGEAFLVAKSFVSGISGVTLVNIETDDAWVRDYVPTFVTAAEGKSQACVNWKYNAWGQKYPPWDKDEAVGRRTASFTELECLNVNLVMEGGAIDGNGRGTILTTESCVLNSNRNPQATLKEVDACFAEYLGATNVLWLRDAELAGDDTDGHIDQIARFVNPQTVVVASEDDPTDANFRPLRSVRRQLAEMRDQDGHSLQLVFIPMPRPVHWQDERLPASYANFYIANGAVIVPQFDDPSDQPALTILGELFSDRKVVGFPCVDLVLGLGSIHCLTQQQPSCG